MKGLSTRSKTVSNSTNITKMKQKRIRTWSSDSGCDVANDYSDQMLCSMEDSIQSWTDMLEKVVRQEVGKAKSVTKWAKEEIRHSEGNINANGTSKLIFNDVKLVSRSKGMR